MGKEYPSGHARKTAGASVQSKQEDLMDESPRSALSFEDFIEAATSAALRATDKYVKAKGDRFRPPPIWVGIIIREFDDIQQVGNPQQG